ncbi:spore protease YyaC [Paenibacillus sp. GSMTC-2017]|uniref:spore protease YyaC n=1 Tax=Paenibacillus sp. GSMTC-2017 TaxID=2794350 RepID=UPI001A2C1672|nr:spore protease YyaC [Paenibacillus sp. GSMTC-2017]MBH5320014.1 spore protease YyaC [Paenibacillus sp. GSMTC-2017]
MNQSDLQLETFFSTISEAHPDPSRIIFVCIGTDRSTGDAFGPFVGTMLVDRGWKVIGTLEKPCDAYAVDATVRDINRLQEDEALTVIAIDACLGKSKSVGSFITKNGPLQPGAATGRRLPFIGDYSIAGIVNIEGPKAYWMLQTTSLHQVMGMANHVVTAVNNAWSGKEEYPKPIHQLEVK